MEKLQSAIQSKLYTLDYLLLTPEQLDNLYNLLSTSTAFQGKDKEYVFQVLNTIDVWRDLQTIIPDNQ